MKAAKAHRTAAVDALKAGAPFNEQTVSHARALQDLFVSIPAMFPRKGNYKESDASAEIWKQWEEFERRSKEAADIAGGMEKAAELKDWRAVKGRLSAIGKACKGCYDKFRE